MGLKKRIASRKFTDERLVRLLGELSRSKSRFWRAVAKKLSTPRGQRVAVNVSKLERLGGEFVLVVPGKVLGTGAVSKKIEVAAYSFSRAAVEKIEGAGGRVAGIDELFRSNPEGKGVRMVV